MPPVPDSFGLACVPPRRGRDAMRRFLAILHAAIFVAFLTAWTIALLSPVPTESAERTLGSAFWVFIFGKCLHISAYAFLAVLGGTIVLLGRNREFVFLGLVAHGIITEYVQQYVGRTGSLRDVCLDAVGISIGWIVVTIWRRIAKRRSARGSTASPEPSMTSEAAPPYTQPTIAPNRTTQSAEH